MNIHPSKRNSNIQIMVLQKDFLGIIDLKEFPQREKSQIHMLLEDMLSPVAEHRREAVDRLYEMDAHRRSPLAASLFVYRLFEPDVSTRAKIAQSIYEAVGITASGERPPAKVRVLLHEALRELGEREVYSMLELLEQEYVDLETVSIILNHCSSSCDILLKLLDSREERIPIRIAASQVIGHLGILEAVPVLEALEERLTHQASSQLSMFFASRSFEEARDLTPALRQTLDALREASL
jgi:hypothetical protein